MPVHGIGGSALENLRLKRYETRLGQPGFSVLLGGSPQEAAMTMRRAYPHATKLHEAAKLVASATVRRIRAIGFDVLAVRSEKLPNHGRINHPTGLAGFSDENLKELAAAFDVKTGC